MPEHEETDAPELDAEKTDEDAFWDELDAVIARRRKKKADRWGVEDKVVDGESK